MSAPYVPPPKQKSKAPWIVLGVIIGFLVLIIGGCAVGVVLLARNTDVREVFNDFSIDFTDGVAPTGPISCEVTGLNTFKNYDVTVTVTNASGETSAYQVDHELFGPGGESLGIDIGIIGRVEPGATVSDDTFGVISGDLHWSDVSCEVSDAVRVPVD